MKTHPLLVAAALTVLTAGPALAQGTTNPPPAGQQTGQTADEQSQSKADLALLQKIRQAIVKDKTLSTNAHNCKVITRDGAVTLRGPVDSTKEKEAVEKIAQKEAGQGKVTNELVVKPSK